METFDNEADRLYFNRKTDEILEDPAEDEKEESKKPKEDPYAYMREKAAGLRRTASYSNIIRENVDEEDEDDSELNGGKTFH